jgi:hypothetical protein
MTQQIPIANLEKYGYTDLAAGKDARTKRKTARQCIVVGARDWLSRWYWLYIWAGKLTTSDLKKKILDTQEVYQPRRFGIEANGMQVMFGSIVRDEAKERFGHGIKMMQIYQPTNVDKNYRIRTGTEPAILQGRFFLQKSEVDARVEMAGFPTAATKDIIDAMETCMNRVAPKQTVARVKDTEYEEYAKYLRASHMPVYLIDQEMKKFKVQQRNATLH